MAKTAAANLCPCGSGLAYVRCCEPWHRGLPAPSAEALMRSRYSAYVLNLHDYLLATWHQSTRPESLDESPADSPTRWLGLEVKRHVQSDETHAIVEFVARFRAEGRGHRLHEVSRFVHEDGRWFYIDGDFPGARC